MKKYKVVQWATGGMGRNCLRALIDHPAMELVGVYVYGADKEGRDAGTLARREPTGVIATRNVDEILALDADVVIHAARLAPPYGSHDADMVTAGHSIGVASELQCWRLHAGQAGRRCSARA
jgi:2,4-diaminopentanoate dehydrogenase